jgi:pimeloyl-ACP methyl ester carboxylesterase
MKISEQAVLLGKRKSLVGIITQSVGSTESCEGLAVVILNTGIIHRVGHHRMYVTFSRVLAEVGYTVLRFDLAGIGDSDNRADNLSPLESSLADITEVLDWLESTRQIKRVVLVGLCSGADHAVIYGSSDPRVVGLVLMDPSLPPTMRYFRDRIGRRLLRLSSWVSIARTGSSNLGKMLIEGVAGQTGWESRNPTLNHPKLRSQLEHVYKRAVEQGIQFLVILTGDGRQSYREQLLDAFPNVSFSGQLRLEFFDDCDHLFTLEADRARLLKIILEWLRETVFHKMAAD